MTVHHVRFFSTKSCPQAGHESSLARQHVPGQQPQSWSRKSILKLDYNSHFNSCSHCMASYRLVIHKMMSYRMCAIIVQEQTVLQKD